MIEKDHLGDWSPEKDCCWRLMIQHLNLKMTFALVVKTSITNNSPPQDSSHPYDLFQSRYSTLLLYQGKMSYQTIICSFKDRKDSNLL